MLATNRESIPSHYHPGLQLGAVIGALAKEGRDKVTIYTTESLTSFGNWAEQLLAESLGKEGGGALPVAGATIGMPHDYVTDRLFIYLRVDNDADVVEKDAGVRAHYAKPGIHVSPFAWRTAIAIAGEFFRWEYATAIAGAMHSKLTPLTNPTSPKPKTRPRRSWHAYQETRGPAKR